MDYMQNEVQKMTKSPEEIKKGLACHAENGLQCLNCSECVYHGKGARPCRIAIHEDAIGYIEELEARISLMKIQMRGDCGCCAYNKRPLHQPPCSECMCFPTRPKWEYEGLPEIDA